MSDTEITKHLHSICSGSASCCVGGSHSRIAVDLHTLSPNALCTSSRANSVAVRVQIGCKGIVQKRKNKLKWNMRTVVETYDCMNTAIASNASRGHRIVIPGNLYFGSMVWMTTKFFLLTHFWREDD